MAFRSALNCSNARRDSPQSAAVPTGIWIWSLPRWRDGTQSDTLLRYALLRANERARDNAGVVAPFATRQTDCAGTRFAALCAGQSINDYGRVMTAQNRDSGRAPLTPGVSRIAEAFRSIERPFYWRIITR